ncbi:MAG: cytochrome c4 [Rhodocyclaceae bacterium]|nr:cytochrome c4 [Rhodocyclaceae bacterium]
MIALTAFALLAATSFTASANQPQKATAKGDAERGKLIAAGTCAACHGADGNSQISTNPKLAGQHPEYLYKQMKNFVLVDGKPAERANAVMMGMMATLNDGQMRDVAAWFASQKQTGDKARNPDTIARGQKLYRAGDVSKGLPACAGCHGPAGAGMPAQYPRIGGQFADYTEAQLKAFRDGARSNDANTMMRTVALKMTDAEIKAVSDYVAGLR